MYVKSLAVFSTNLTRISLDGNDGCRVHFDVYNQRDILYTYTTNNDATVACASTTCREQTRGEITQIMIQDKHEHPTPAALPVVSAPPLTSLSRVLWRYLLID